MRFNLALFSLIGLLAMPALAQNYAVQPMPASWNSATNNQPNQNRDDQIEVEMNEAISIPTSNLPNAQNANLDQALVCASALQIAALAAPQWSNEHGVAQATNLWLERVFAIAEQNNISGDRVNELVKGEMERQTNSSVANPGQLNRTAFDCATNRP